jgi:Zn finger protein HypA/HybF involved in hydrogenase expression
MILSCDECGYNNKLENFDFVLGENSAKVVCPKCEDDEFKILLSFKCLECGEKDFRPVDNSVGDHRHYNCPKCGSLNIGFC